MKSPRKIVTRAPHRRVGYIACPWLQDRHIAYESLLEASFIRIALLCPHVQEIDHQPFRLDLGAGFGTYTPDFLLRCKGLQNLVVEVKPSVHIAKHREKLNAARVRLKERNCEFLVCSEEEIHSDGRAERASEIQRHSRSVIPVEQVNPLLAELPRFVYPASANSIAGKLGTTMERVLYLVGRRHLRLPRDLRTEGLYYSEQGEIYHGDLSARAWIGSATW